MMDDGGDGRPAEGPDEAQRYRLLAENASDVIVLLGADGRVAWVSPSISAFAGWRGHDLVGGDPWAFVHPDDMGVAERAFAEATSSADPVPPFEVRVVRFDGNEVYVSISARGVFEKGNADGVVVAIRDVDEKVRANQALATALDVTRSLWDVRSASDARHAAERLVTALGGVVVAAEGAGPEALPADLSFGDGPPILPSAPFDSTARSLIELHLPGFLNDARTAVGRNTHIEQLAEDASIDPLTGIPNRRMLGRALGRLGEADVVIMLDLDHFKALNDELGHQAGDDVLYEFGRTLRDTARSRDIVGRYGGEEFLVLMRDEGATRFLERLRERWEHRRPHPVTFSAGVAAWLGSGPETVARADEALYRAKRGGRDGWVVAAEETASLTRYGGRR
ncbi:sensor domain-containing diguanylate cyclase [Rhabdothermincola salaria]|uniref:sensor domain-containing diguanylate cyclase n=1 Tax=Rhabdothermincola salaria TaxID=2903142 RepID=UPI001E616FB8|nr:sensor domain-containing diguanylate cyclase [Rhabdothermincola salaria]MCD9623289.1 sensor domain-containing diguanylate cyclase [Rhabdothermincola salaria]